MTPFIVGALVTGLIMIGLSIWGLIHQCPPNQVLVFAGTGSTEGGRTYGYRLVKGRMGIKRPFLEKVYSMDLTNMIIELSATNAYAKGGIPLHVHGVANVKIAGHSPNLNNAIERFLGKSRAEIMAIAKATLEGSLRGVLATLTPEQINEDRNLFQERLVQEAEQDMAALGLVVDTLKIQNITDDVKYLDSIGRIRNAELLSSARVAEAIARADSMVREAENNETEVEAQIKAQIAVANADAEKMLMDARTRRAAVVAEEEAAVAALVAQAEAEINVQKARIEQVRRRLEADVIAPAKAECEAVELAARAEVAPIIEDGRARAEALVKLAESWTSAGQQAREIFLIQKIEPIIRQLTETISETRIEKVTVIDQPSGGGGKGMTPQNLLALNEQIKEVFGVDLADKIASIGSGSNSNSSSSERPQRQDNAPQLEPPPIPQSE